MKRIPLALASLAIVAGCARRIDVAATTARFATLNAASEPFHAAFNRARNEVRVVELVSPTCPICLEGVSKIQRAVFAKETSKRLAGFIVWDPMLDGTSGNVPSAMELAPDPRIVQYWDGLNDVGIEYGRLLPVASGLAWDVYMVFAPGVVWSGRTPPRPAFWMHQLNITNAPRLDPALFDEHVHAMLAARRPS